MIPTKSVVMQATTRAQPDYYASLEIAPAATSAEVKIAFRHLAWRYHPDHNPDPGATCKFQEINEAHRVLSSPVLRSRYDAKRQMRSVRQSDRPCSVAHSCRRHSFRRRHTRAIILTLASILAVPSAWAVILGAFIAAHPPSHLEELSSSQSQTGWLHECTDFVTGTPVFQDDVLYHGSAVRETDAHDGGTGYTLAPLSLPETTQRPTLLFTDLVFAPPGSHPGKPRLPNHGIPLPHSP